MHLELLVEEESAEAFLRSFLPRILGVQHGFQVYVHQGKSDLLHKLPFRLRAYSSWLPADWRIVVLIDEDREDCFDLKQSLENAAAQAGLRTRSASNGLPVQVVNRIAVEELEAWYFGDASTLSEVFPRVSRNLASQATYRDPDRIAGGTWETLERLLQRKGYCRGGLPKIELARAMGERIDPERNRSRSFQSFYRAIRALLAETS